MMVVTVAGLTSYFRLGRNEDPAFTFRTMVVQAAWPGATLDETLSQVTERLERKLQEIKGLDFLRKRPDGRELAPIMPWRAFANLTKDDATAIAMFLKSVPEVKNRVPGPFGRSEQSTSFVMKIVAGDGMKSSPPAAK
jgi:hypothetical protein